MSNKLLTGSDVLKWAYSKGIQFCKVYSPKAKVESAGKRPMGENWQNKPYNLTIAKKHLKSGGNVGMICGPHSAMLYLLDIDRRYADFIEKFPQFASSPTSTRQDPETGELADKGKIIIYVKAALKGIKLKLPDHPTDDNSPDFEILGIGNQGVIAGRHPLGVDYMLANPDGEIQSLTIQELDQLCQEWTGLPYIDPEPEPEQSPEQKPEAQKYKGSSDGLREDVIDHWTPLKVFHHFGLDQNGTRKPDKKGWIRILGNGGLFAHQDGDSWYAFSDSLGGDAISAWVYCETGAVNMPKGRDFTTLLKRMADTGGIIPRTKTTTEHQVPEPENFPEDPEPDRRAAARTKRWTVAELLDTEFPEPNWSIPDIIPEGLVILGGRPKVGKSWLLLQMAHSIGTGGMFFDRKVEKGKVLLLAYEDNPRRLKDRINKMKIPRGALIDFQTGWRPLQNGGLDDLLIEMERGDYRMIAIDTLTRSIPGIDPKKDEGIISQIFDDLQALAIERGQNVTLADHTRKPTGFASDPIDDIMNLTAKTAISDAVLALYKERGKPGAILKGRGRDMEDVNLSLLWDVQTCCWQSLGDADEVSADSFKGEVLRAIRDLNDLDEPATLTRIAAHIDAKKSNISRALGDLVMDNQVIRLPKQGKEVPYTLVSV